MMEKLGNLTPLPIRGDLAPAYRLSLLTAALSALAALAGLLFGEWLYPTETLQQNFATNDIGNLVLCVPALLVPAVLARQGKFTWLLLWLGGLLVITYAFIPYAVAMLATPLVLLYLVIVGLSVFALVRLVTNLDMDEIKHRLGSRVHPRFSGIVLAVFGMAFLGLAVNQGLAALQAPSTSVLEKLGTPIADVILSIMWLLNGIWLFQRKPRGFTTGLGLFFQLLVLFAGLLLYFALLPLLTPQAFPVDDFIVILGMAAVCAIPFIIYLRGVIARKSTNTL